MYMIMDMGTSNTRLWLYDTEAVAGKTAPVGAGTSKIKGKAFLYAEVKKLIHGLLEENGLRAEAIEHILVSGMAGSELGLMEIAHIGLPADIYTLADNLQTHVLEDITQIPFVFVPGLKKECGGQLADIMRGEETETAGILQRLDLREEAVLVLPGTHNKVVCTSADGQITDFYTTLSGELLNDMVNNSILAGQVSHRFAVKEADVLRGAMYAKENGLNAALFHIRVMAKNGKEGDVLSSFLYGSVLGQDMDLIRRLSVGRKLYIGGRDSLKQVYSILLGETAVRLDERVASDAVRTGLSCIYGLYKARKDRETVLRAIEKEKLIAIVRAPQKDTFLDAMKALYQGGVRLAEVTFDRSGKIPKEQTAQLIRQLRESLPMLVGAGTVTTTQDVMLAYQAGAAYIISPNCDLEIIRLTKRLGLVSIPAAFTPTEIAAAAKAGADFIKLFPADQVSAGYVKAVKAPLSDVKLLAVGGVDADNAGTFLQNGFTGVGVGSNLYNKSLIAAGDWDGLETIAREYVEAVQ